MLGGERPADQISLRLVAAHLLQQAQGGCVFDAFSDDALPELMGKLDTRLHDGAIAIVGAHFQDEDRSILISSTGKRPRYASEE